MRDSSVHDSPVPDSAVAPYAAARSIMQTSTPNDPAYGSTYYKPSGSLPTPASGLSDPSSVSEAVVTSPQVSPTHHSMSGVMSGKRAYRQRRKDPSCDACRERKVKCDATDASSCSECSSRSVKCQFTKETNRRMSSMKQVQDLERQLQQARQQISQLKSAMQDNNSPNNSASNHATALSSLVAQDHVPRERVQATRAMQNFFQVRRNIRNYCRGIFKPPQAYRPLGIQMVCTDSDTPLPPKHLVDTLLAQFRTVLHPQAPLLHWPTFQAECDTLYRAGTFQGLRKIWMSIFFAVLACGSLLVEPNPQVQSTTAPYVEMALKNINNRTDEVTIDHARATLLISIYFMEQNLRSTGWVWLSGAVRTAQEAGLHCDPGQQTQMQAEMRRRVWWSIYNYDRLCSLEMGQPPSVSDGDVDVSEPTPIDDDLIGPNGFQTPVSRPNTPNYLIVLIPVTRIIAQLKRAFKSRAVTAATLKIYDDHFNSIMDSYPEPYPLASTAPLDPSLLPPALSLQAARFFLYRHNLSVAARPQERQDALERCVQVAKDTAHYIYRSTPAAHTQGPRLAIHPPEHISQEWQDRVRTTANSFLCTHLWRCSLILCFSGEYAVALTCVTAMAAVGNRRRINVACGRNLAFFLDLLMERIKSGRAGDGQFDEEMLAYASADLQGCHDSAWAWLGSEPGANVGPSSPDHAMSGHDSFEPMTSPPAQRPTVLLTKDEEKEWGGWDRIEGMLRQLIHGHPGQPPVEAHQRQHQAIRPQTSQPSADSRYSPELHRQSPMAPHGFQRKTESPYTFSSPPQAHHQASHVQHPGSNNGSPLIPRSVGSHPSTPSTSHPPGPPTSNAPVSRISIKDII